jgi:hypothetical protein
MAYWASEEHWQRGGRKRKREGENPEGEFHPRAHQCKILGHGIWRLFIALRDFRDLARNS